jgi:hypothetical protein
LSSGNSFITYATTPSIFFDARLSTTLVKGFSDEEKLTDREVQRKVSRISERAICALRNGEGCSFRPQAEESLAAR